MRRRRGKQEAVQGDSPVRDDPIASKEEEEEEESPSVTGKTKELKKRGSKCSLTRVIKWIVGIFVFVAVAVAVVVGLVMFVVVFMDEFRDWMGYERAQDISLPPHVMDLFDVFDGNKDGVLDPFEFAIVAEQLRNVQTVSQTRCKRARYQLTAL